MATDSIFDCRKRFLTGEYQVCYQRLPLDEVSWGSAAQTKNSLCVELRIKRSCDLINMLDVAIDNPDGAPLNTLLRRIDVEYGGACIDSLDVGDDLETQIETNCAIFRRTGVSHLNGKTFVPLVAAPLHQHNLVFPSTKCHTLCIRLVFKEPGAYLAARHDSVVPYGNMYSLSESPCNRSFALLTIQNQYRGPVPMKRGVNTIDLRFHHPVYMMYFWGPDLSKIKSIDVRFSSTSSFYRGPPGPLERAKAVRGLSHVRPMCVFFCDALDFTDPTQCTVNFSRINNANLVIETDEEVPPPVHVVGLNSQPLRYAANMVGLTFMTSRDRRARDRLVPLEANSNDPRCTSHPEAGCNLLSL